MIGHRRWEGARLDSIEIEMLYREMMQQNEKNTNT